MIHDQHVLAVVPARSGSKGIPDKNMQPVGGMSLIARAAKTLEHVDVVDRRVLSTDSLRYASEGKRYGLEVLSLRPKHLSTDSATAVDTISHALLEAESQFKIRFGVVLIVEPTSPLRRAEDVDEAARLLVSSGADSVVTVSPLDPKFHPDKLLVVDQERLSFHTSNGARIHSRQSLQNGYFWRNGACYAISRNCLLENRAIITDKSIPLVTPQTLVNIDSPWELALADCLVSRSSSGEPEQHAA